MDSVAIENWNDGSIAGLGLGPSAQPMCNANLEHGFKAEGGPSVQDDQVVSLMP